MVHFDCDHRHNPSFRLRTLLVRVLFLPLSARVRYNKYMLTRRSVVSIVYRHWLTLSFVAGFITDLILLDRVDDVFDNLVLLFYVCLATISLLTLYATATERLPSWFNRNLGRVAPFVMQYSFGGLLSGMLIFYGRSGDWLTSAPYLGLLIVVMVLNEILQKRSDRLVYHLALYSIGIFSYVVLVVPVWLGAVGEVVFVLSSIGALLIVTIIVQLLLRIAPHFVQLSMRRIVFTIGTLFVALQAAYFGNILPPIPLSLTELSIVYEASRTNTGGYRLVYADWSWYEHVAFWQLPVYRPGSGSLSCFARIYAPVRLQQTTIVHRWQVWEPEQNLWRDHFALDYAISGAARDGFRGFTTISNFSDGTWRCVVENQRGQRLGRRTFVVDRTSTARGPVVTVVE